MDYAPSSLWDGGILCTRSLQLHQEHRNVMGSSSPKLPPPGLCILFVLLGLAVGGGATSFALQRRAAARDVIVSIRGVPITASAFYRKLEARTGRDAMAKLAADALALRFAASLGATPSAEIVDATVREQRRIP